MSRAGGSPRRSRPFRHALGVDPSRNERRKLDFRYAPAARPAPSWRHLCGFFMKRVSVRRLSTFAAGAVGVRPVRSEPAVRGEFAMAYLDLTPMLQAMRARPS